ncbi:MAG: ExbD/TolR family protein [Planctomycetota bacterium]|jgi:biopolymer transport protein ExbD
MTTERERIEKLLADGKVSPMEAERLRAALEKSEREEAQAPPGPREAIVKPKLSRLAVAGALGLPAAVATFLFVMGLALVFGVIEERAAGGGLMMAAAVALVGVGLSIAGLVVTRREPGRFSGRRLATAGIVAPIVAAVLGGAGLAIVVYQHEKWAEAQALEMKRVVESWKRKEERAMQEAIREREEVERRRREEYDRRQEELRAKRQRAADEKEAQRLEEEKRQREKEERRQEGFRAAVRRAAERKEAEEAERRRRAAGRVTVTVSRDGALAVEGKGGAGARAVELAAFVEELRALVKAGVKPVVEIKADPATPHDKVKALLDALAKAGVTDVTMRVE